MSIKGLLSHKWCQDRQVWLALASGGHLSSAFQTVGLCAFLPIEIEPSFSSRHKCPKLGFGLPDSVYPRIASSQKVPGEKSLAGLASWGPPLIYHHNTGVLFFPSYGKELSLFRLPWLKLGFGLPNSIQGLFPDKNCWYRQVLLALASWGLPLICLQNVGALPFPYCGKEPSFPSWCLWSKLGYHFQLDVYPRIVPR